MVIQTAVEIQLHCPHCRDAAKFLTHVFALKQSTCEWICPCGTWRAVLFVTDKRYHLRVTCGRCQSEHVMANSWASFLHFSETRFLCPKDGDLVLTWTRYADVQSMDEDQEIVAMHEMIGKLQALSDSGLLECEVCGRCPELEVQPNRVELTCFYCDRTKVYWARQEDDLLSMPIIDHSDSDWLLK